MLRTRCDDAYLFFIAFYLLGEMAERLIKIVRNDFEHQRLLLMARRAKYRKYFVTRSPTGECLAQYKSGRAITRKLDINGEMAERLKALPC